MHSSLQLAAQVTKKAGKAHLPLDPSTVLSDDPEAGVPYAHNVPQIRFNPVDFEAMLNDEDVINATVQNEKIEAEQMDPEDDEERVWDFSGERLKEIEEFLEKGENFEEELDSISERKELERIFHAQERMPDPELELALAQFEILPPTEDPKPKKGYAQRAKAKARQEKIDLFNARKEAQMEARLGKKKVRKAGDFIPSRYSDYYGNFLADLQLFPQVICHIPTEYEDDDLFVIPKERRKQRKKLAQLKRNQLEENIDPDSPDELNISEDLFDSPERAIDEVMEAPAPKKKHTYKDRYSRDKSNCSIHFTLFEVS